MSKGTSLLRLVVTFLACLPLAGVSWAAHINTHAPAKSKAQKISESQRTRRRIRRLARSRSANLTSVSATTRRRRYHERFHMSSFAEDIAAGDITTGEDPVVRQAAIDALGNMNGTVVAIEPTSGRVLAMVNQKLALSSGAQPCSTIKLSVAMAALSEGLVSKETEVALGGRSRMNLTTALAHSNNAYFEALGRKLGFEKVAYYAHEYGLGELAGYNIPGEQLGSYPEEAIPAKLGGVGKMCSFGEGVSMTPLQLGAMVSAIANGGTLYYLQHPTTPEEVASFQPRVEAASGHRSLDSRTFRWHGRRGAIRHGPQPPPQLQRRRNSGQDRNLLARRYALRLVRLLRQHQRRPRGRRCLPARRTTDLRSQGRRDLPDACIATCTTTISSSPAPLCPPTPRR